MTIEDDRALVESAILAYRLFGLSDPDAEYIADELASDYEDDPESTAAWYAHTYEGEIAAPDFRTYVIGHGFWNSYDSWTDAVECFDLEAGYGNGYEGDVDAFRFDLDRYDARWFERHGRVYIRYTP